MSTLADCNRQFARYALDAAATLREPRTPILFGKLPAMTDPWGVYWPQPKALHERVRIYETHAAIDEADWNALPRYDSSFPSGVYPGKAWRRGGYLCWYGPARGATVRLCHARALVQ